jgi:hypothetical protein
MNNLCRLAVMSQVVGSSIDLTRNTRRTIGEGLVMLRTLEFWWIALEILVGDHRSHGVAFG